MMSTSMPWAWSTRNTSTLIVTAVSNNSDLSLDKCDVDVQTSTLKLAYTLFMLILLLLSLLGNSGVVLAVLLSNKLTDRSTFYFIASLACSDMVMAMFQIPFRISVALHGMKFCLGLPACYVRMIMDVFGNVASILNLFLVSIDRFIAVQLPYRYVTLLSKGRTKKIIIATWLLAGCWGVLMIFRWERKSTDESILSIAISNDMCVNDDNCNYLISYFGIYMPILVLMTGIYVRILQLAIKQIREIEKSIPRRKKSSIQKLAAKKKKQKANNHRKSSLRKEIKATKSVAIVYLTFCLCWLPSVIFYIILFVRPGFFDDYKPMTSKVLWFTFVDIFPMINTMINPIIYSFSNRQFRYAVVDVFRKFMGKARKRDGSIFMYAVPPSDQSRLSRLSDRDHSTEDSLLPHLNNTNT